MPDFKLQHVPKSLFARIEAAALRNGWTISDQVIALLVEEVDVAQARMPDDCIVLTANEQAELWKDLCGSWEDSRSAKEIVEDIRNHRK